MNKNYDWATWCRATVAAVVLAGTWAISTPVSIAQTSNTDGDPLPPLPPVPLGAAEPPSSESGSDPVLQEVFEEPETSPELEPAEATAEANNAPESEPIPSDAANTAESSALESDSESDPLLQEVLEDAEASQGTEIAEETTEPEVTSEEEPLPPVPPSSNQPVSQESGTDPLLQEIIDRADTIREEEGEDISSDDSDESELDAEVERAESDDEESVPLFGPGVNDLDDSAPPILVPEDPQDIVTPDAAPSLEIPDDAPPVEPIPAFETLSLPEDPLEVRVESVQGFSLDEALEIALERNPDIINAQLEVEIAGKGIRAARAEYSPQLSTNLTYSFSDPAVPDGNTGGSDFGIEGSNIQNIINGELRFDFTVIDGGGRIARNLIADQGLAVAEYNLDQITQDVRLSVAEAYFNLQLTDTQVLVAEADLVDSESSLKDASARERAGIGTRFEVLQAESRLANDRQALIAARNNQRVSRFQLSQLLSFDESVESAATDPIEPSEAWPLSLEETLVQAFQNRAEFDSILENFELERQNAQAALSAIRPNISIFSTLDYTAQLDDTFSQEAFIARGFSVGATFTWNAYDGGAALANAQQADLAREQQRNSFASARDAIRFEVENAFFSLNSFREQIDAAKVGLESAQESLRLARLRFEAGVGTQTDVLSSQSELSDARQNLATAVSNYNISIVQLKRAVNNL